MKNPIVWIVLMTAALLAWIGFSKDVSAPAPVEAAPVTAPASAPSESPSRLAPPPTAPASAALLAAGEEERETVTSLDPVAEQAHIEAELAYLDHLRALPGARELVDEVVAYLQGPGANDFSLDGVPTDEHGAFVLSEDTVNQMIRDPGIRAKWMRLMKIILEQGGQAG
jgi:hypothetical protein